MVSAAYDHLVAIVVVSVIFVGTVVALPAINYSNMQTMDQQQLRNAALNVFDSMLLDVGSPSNWGSDLTTVSRYGLAYADPFSKYVLDNQKVQRINKTTNADFLKYEDIRTLLDIEEDYGFQFTLSRPYEVNWNLTIEGGNWVHFNVTVARTEDETPIPNAEVRVTSMAAIIKSNKDIDELELPTILRYTNSSGECEERQQFVLPDAGTTISQAVCFMQISVAGLLTTAVARSSDPFNGLVTIHTEGDAIELSIPEAALQIPSGGPSEDKIIEVIAYKDGEMITLYKFSTGGDHQHINTGAGDFATWTGVYDGLRALDPTALLLWVELTLSNPGHGTGKPTEHHIWGRQLVLLSGSLDFASSGTIITTGPDPKDENPIVIMRRLVVISDMTYVAQIEFWRE